MVETPRRPTTEKRTSLPSRDSSRWSCDARADDLRVERAGQAAVAGDQQDARPCAAPRAPGAPAGCAPRPRPPRRPGGSSCAARARRGADASIRCSARRRRAAATISMARVIFCTFFTEEIRFLTSLRVAMRCRLRGRAGLLLLGLRRPRPRRRRRRPSGSDGALVAPRVAGPGRTRPPRAGCPPGRSRARSRRSPARSPCPGPPRPRRRARRVSLIRSSRSLFSECSLAIRSPRNSPTRSVLIRSR